MWLDGEEKGISQIILFCVYDCTTTVEYQSMGLVACMHGNLSNYRLDLSYPGTTHPQTSEQAKCGQNSVVG